MNTITRAAQRARSYWFIDGIPDLLSGGVLLVNGVLFYLQGIIDPASALAFWQIPLRLVATIGIFVAGLLVPRWLKVRITYPRTGYTEPQRPSPNAQVFSIIAGMSLIFAVPVLCAVLFIFSIAGPPFSNLSNAFGALVPSLGAFALSATLTYLAYRHSVTRYYALSAFSFVLTLSLLVLALRRDLRLPTPYAIAVDLGLYFMLMGGALLLSGMLTLRAYLREHPRPMEEAL